ncbi:MAG TPA: branched-chain amino acid ABC transporter permease [Candidatus Methylomirabilis sp.]|nr:branched-chain amino acid ABC transporter permease [Candidatus Methylomirabilis sp.]
MEWARFAEQLVGALAIGCIYSLIALGYSMIIRATEILHFAQGEIVMLGAMFGVTLFRFTPLPYVAVFIIAMALAGVAGFLLEVGVYRVLRGRKVTLLNIMIATVGVSIVLQNVARLTWGSEPIRYPTIYAKATYSLGPLQVPTQMLWVVLAGLALMVALQLFFEKTRQGLALQAAAQDPQTAQLMGINLDRTISLTFAISGAVGGAAGVLLAPMFFATFDMGFITGIKGFVAATLGGLGSIPGAMLGGILFGILETFGAIWISTSYKDAIGMILLIVILLVFPQGLMGLIGQGEGRR